MYRQVLWNEEAIIDKLVLENQILNNKLIFIKAIIELEDWYQNKKKRSDRKSHRVIKVDLIDGYIWLFIEEMPFHLPKNIMIKSNKISH
jgi:hypothetical protein